MRQNNPKSYRVQAFTFDFLSVVDPQWEEKQRIQDVLDDLSIEERDLVSCRYGLLDYTRWHSIVEMTRLFKVSRFVIMRRLEEILDKIKHRSRIYG